MGIFGNFFFGRVQVEPQFTICELSVMRHFKPIWSFWGCSKHDTEIIAMTRSGVRVRVTKRSKLKNTRIWYIIISSIVNPLYGSASTCTTYLVQSRFRGAFFLLVTFSGLTTILPDMLKILGIKEFIPTELPHTAMWWMKRSRKQYGWLSGQNQKVRNGDAWYHRCAINILWFGRKNYGLEEVSPSEYGYVGYLWNFIA